MPKSTETYAQKSTRIARNHSGNKLERISQMHHAMPEHVLHFSDCFVLRLGHIAPREGEEEDKTGGEEQH